MAAQTAAIDHLYWLDDEGPVASVVLTDWGRAWGCDPIVVPGVSAPPLSIVWARALEAIDTLGLEAVEALARDDDFDLLRRLAGAGFVPDDDRAVVFPRCEDVRLGLAEHEQSPSVNVAA